MSGFSENGAGKDSQVVWKRSLTEGFRGWEWEPISILVMFIFQSGFSIGAAVPGASASPADDGADLWGKGVLRKILFLTVYFEIITFLFNTK